MRRIHGLKRKLEPRMDTNEHECKTSVMDLLLAIETLRLHKDENMMRRNIRVHSC